MPDYNPAVAAGIQPPQQQNWAGTLGTVANIQAERARTGLYTLQGLQQQRQYNGLMAAAEAFRTGKDPVAAAAPYGLDPTMLNSFQTLQSGGTFMRSHGGLAPQGAEANANIARAGAETALTRAKIPGALAESDIQGRQAAAAAASQYAADPSEANWRAARNTTAKYQGEDAARPLDAITDPQARMARMTGHIGATPEGNKLVQTQTPSGAPQYQTSAQFQTRGPQTGQTAAAKTEQAELGTTLGKMPAQLASAAQDAIQQNTTLDQMRSESASWPMGRGAETLMKAQSYIKPIANAFGNTDFDKPVADFESFQKNSGTLVRQAVKEVSSRAAVQEFNLIAKQLPSAGMTRQGFGQIADQFSAVNDYKIAKQQAGQTWLNKNGTMAGFDADWNKNVSPTAFLVGRMNSDQVHQMAQGLQKTPEGRTALGHIKEQLQYAKDNGLF